MMSPVIVLLTKLLVILIFLRIAVELLPRWLLAVIIFLLILYFNVLDPRVVRQIVNASSGLVDLLLPIVFLLITFRIVVSGGFGGRRR